MTALTLSWIAIDTSLSVGVLTLGTASAVLVAAFLIAWGIWLICIHAAVDSGVLDLKGARGLTAGFAVGLIGETVIQTLIVAAAVLKLVRAAECATKMAALEKLGGIWIPISFVLKFSIGVITWLSYCGFYERSLMEIAAS